MEKENVVYKKRQILSSQVDLSKFNKKEFEKATDEEIKLAYRVLSGMLD